MDLSPALKQLVRDMNEETWFKVDGSDKVTGMFGGCRPGEPIVVYVFILARSLRKCVVCWPKRSMVGHYGYDENQFVGARVRRHTAHETEEACAVDCVYFFRHEDPEKLLAAVRFTTEEFCEDTERRGLSVNFAVEKTEALLVLKRAGKNKVKDDLKGRNNTIHVADHELRVVEWYRHMGSMCTPSGAMGFEVCRGEWVARGQRTM